MEPTPDNRHLSRFCVLNSATGKGLQDSTYILQTSQERKCSLKLLAEGWGATEPQGTSASSMEPPTAAFRLGLQWYLGAACPQSFPPGLWQRIRSLGMWVMPGTSDVLGHAFYCFAKWPCIYRHISLQRAKQNEAQFNRQDQRALLNK